MPPLPLFPVSPALTDELFDTPLLLLLLLEEEEVEDALALEVEEEDVLPAEFNAVNTSADPICRQTRHIQ